MSYKYFTLEDANLQGKTVGIRVDINSPIINGKVELNERIVEHSKTIKELAEAGAKVIVLAHQGRKGKDDCISLQEHAKLISGQIGKRVGFINELYSSNVDMAVKGIMPGDVLVLENLRFFDDEKEVEKQGNLILKLEPLFDLFVFDAFSVAHRAQTSVVGFKNIPVIAGRVMQKELEGLNKIMDTPAPHIYCFGGAKPDDLLDLLEKALPEGKVDKVLLSGVIGELAILYKGISIGKKVSFLKEKGYIESLPRVGALLEKFSDKVFIPEDVAIFDGSERIEIPISELNEKHEIVENYMVQDIGSQTLRSFATQLQGAGSIYFKGPCGNFEEENFDIGTQGLLHMITSSGAFTFMGGGHSVTAAQKYVDIKDFSYVSLAGGALIKFLAGEELPGVKSLEQSYFKYNPNAGKEEPKSEPDNSYTMNANTSQTQVSMSSGANDAEEKNPDVEYEKQQQFVKRAEAELKDYKSELKHGANPQEVKKEMHGPDADELSEEIPVESDAFDTFFEEEDLLKPENKKDEEMVPKDHQEEVRVDNAEDEKKEAEVPDVHRVEDELLEDTKDKEVEPEKELGSEKNPEEEKKELEQDLPEPPKESHVKPHDILTEEVAEKKIEEDVDKAKLEEHKVDEVSKPEEKIEENKQTDYPEVMSREEDKKEETQDEQKQVEKEAMSIKDISKEIDRIKEDFMNKTGQKDSEIEASEEKTQIQEPGTFLVVGSNVIDVELTVEEHFSHLHMGEKIVLEKDFQRSVGGAGVNVSACMARLGVKTYCLSKFAEETYSEVSSVLEKNKVEIVKTKVSKRPGAKSIILDTADNDRIIFTYRGQNEFLEVTDFNLESFKIDNVYFSSLGGESFQSILSIAKEIRAKNSKAKICYTPSKHLMDAEPRIRQLISQCDVMILNFEEAQHLIGEDTDISDALRKCHEVGVKNVVITDGSNGSYAYDGEKEYFVKAIKPKKIVDATGAGDCYTATFFRFFASGAGLKKSMELASKNASALIGVKGSHEGLLYLDDLIGEN